MKDYRLEQFGKIIRDAYDIASAHGFHEKDSELNVEHFLMLIVSEIGELVDADRRGRRSGFGLFDDALRTRDFRYCFETYIKDTVEDEFADIAIRIADLCGVYGIEVSPAAMDDYFESDFSCLTFTERAFVLNHMLVSGDDAEEDLKNRLGSALSFVVAWCNAEGIDLARHISMKMKYNEGRPMLNGKKY